MALRSLNSRSISKPRRRPRQHWRKSRRSKRSLGCFKKTYCNFAKGPEQHPEFKAEEHCVKVLRSDIRGVLLMSDLLFTLRQIGLKGFCIPADQSTLMRALPSKPVAEARRTAKLHRAFGSRLLGR